MILQVVLWTLIVLLSIIILLKALPYRLTFRGRIIWMSKQKEGNVAIHFGGVTRGLTIAIYPYRQIGVGQYKNPLFTISLPKRKQQKSKSPKKDRSKQPYLKMGKAALSKVHFDHFSLTGDLGLSNPMHTGLMYGWIQSIGNLIKIDRLNVGIVPLFNNRFETDLDGQFHLKIVPVKVIWQAVKTYFKFKA